MKEKQWIIVCGLTTTVLDIKGPMCPSRHYVEWGRKQAQLLCLASRVLCDDGSLSCSYARKVELCEIH